MVEIIRTAPHGAAVAIAALGVVALGLAAAPVAVRAQPVSPAAVVDAFEKVSGVHPGFRRSGTKGICAAGEFVSTGAGARLTTAVHLQPGARVPAVARFSNGGGVPTAPDNAPAMRGLSLAFTLPGSAGHQFVMINTPAFSSSTPDSLMRFLEVRAPAPGATAADPAKIAAANAANPEWMAQINYLRDSRAGMVRPRSCRERFGAGFGVDPAWQTGLT